MSLKYTKKELAKMAFETLLAISSGDKRGMEVVGFTASIALMPNEKVLKKLEKLARGYVV